MEILIKKEELEKLLLKLTGVSEKRHTLPVLSHFLIEASGDGTVKGVATDLEVIVRATCEGDVKSPGSYLLPTRKMLDVVKVLPTDTAELVLLENGYLQISSGKSKFKIAGLPPKEFPDMPEKEEGIKFSVNSFDFKVMLERVQPFASLEETRAEISGVYLERIEEESGKLRLVATDGHRLAYVEAPMEDLPEGLTEGVIIPRKGVTELRKLLDEIKGDVEISIGETFVSAGTGNYEVTVRLVGGEFPAYREVIPSSFLRSIHVDRERFAEVLRRVSVISTDRLKSVILEARKGELSVYSMSQDIGEAVDYIEAQVEGEELKIGFNAKYLLDVAASSGGETLVMKVNDELSPALFTPGERDDFIAVVMPIRTNM